MGRKGKIWIEQAAYMRQHTGDWPEWWDELPPEDQAAARRIVGNILVRFGRWLLKRLGIK